MENTSNALPRNINNSKMDRGLLRLLIVAYCLVYTVSECPITLEPSTVVVRHGDPVSVNCTVSGDHEGIGWEASEGSVDRVEGVQFVTWGLETLTEWDIRPKCFGDFLIHSACDMSLNITVYKPPDSVSISVVNHTDLKNEGDEYQLQCEVQNIAPVQYLTVKWYKGETLENQTSYDDLTKTPVNVSSTLLITPTSADDGAQYSCVAELELGPEGPQPSPEVKSDPLSITVHYAPFFSSPDETVEVTEGEEVPIKCLALGNPPPAYSWSSPSNQELKTNEMLEITSSSLSPGTYIYTCTASNSYGRQSKIFTVNVIPKDDQTVLWTVIGVGVAVAVLLILGYLYYKSKDGGNSII
ncbi:hypothetical protein COCON_G00206370 [Conger conger]|uniref:Ig-like domain-containing protein n=1 Tax=Conger conger TaxID=82655 RepID=A0A9Q1CZE6_CONCO|nr:hypothetical protein COCON_G00206370 [Conger conger]